VGQCCARSRSQYRGVVALSASWILNFLDSQNSVQHVLTAPPENDDKVGYEQGTVEEYGNDTNGDYQGSSKESHSQRGKPERRRSSSQPSASYRLPRSLQSRCGDSEEDDHEESIPRHRNPPSMTARKLSATSTHAIPELSIRLPSCPTSLERLWAPSHPSNQMKS
jgi:hypothetical protein